MGSRNGVSTEKIEALNDYSQSPLFTDAEKVARRTPPRGSTGRSASHRKGSGGLDRSLLGCPASEDFDPRRSRSCEIWSGTTEQAWFEADRDVYELDPMRLLVETLDAGTKPSPRNYPGSCSQREPKRAKLARARRADFRGFVCGSLALVLIRKGLITQRSLVQIQPPQPGK